MQQQVTRQREVQQQKFEKLMAQQQQGVEEILLQARELRQSIEEMQ
jgi:hypothetical protein